VSKNPFEVFGLTPEMVGELSEKELFGVLKSIHRALQKTFHPDVPGRRPNNGSGRAAAQASAPTAADRTVELNLAFEALDLERNPASFRRSRKSYVARRSSALQRSNVALRGRLGLQVEREDKLAEGFLTFLAGGAAWTRAGSDSTNAEAAAKGGKDSDGKHDAGRPRIDDGRQGGAADAPPRLSALLPARNVRLGLLDLAIANNVKQSSWLLGSNYKQLEIDADGRLSVKLAGRRRFARADFIHLLGSVPSGALDLPPLLERNPAKFFKSPAVYPGSDCKAQLSVLNLISRDNFKRYILPLLVPVLSERSYLFSLNRTEFTTNGLISLEGVVIKFENL
jgi:hypothetical protein